jgi:hypothetical protein
MPNATGWRKREGHKPMAVVRVVLAAGQTISSAVCDQFNVIDPRIFRSSAK